MPAEIKNANHPPLCIIVSDLSSSSMSSFQSTVIALCHPLSVLQWQGRM